METYTAEEVYTDEELSKIADGGFNAIWVHGQLHNLVRHPLLPEFGLFAEQHQEKMRTLIARAAKYGIKVFIYCQSPRAVSEEFTEFWKAHADLSGAVYPLETQGWEIRTQKESVNFISLCTTLPQVRQYIREGFASLGAALPDLGGYIVITASEYPSQCLAHSLDAEHTSCPRCSKRPPAEVVAELINCVVGGVHDSAPQQEVIVWDWGWRGAAGAEPTDVLNRLDRSAIYMGNCETGATAQDGSEIQEYAFCVDELSPQFRNNVETALARGMRVCAKLQINVTHEIAVIPNMPVPGQIFNRAQWIRGLQECAGYLGCWNFGNEITCNTAAFNFFVSHDCPADCHEALLAFAAYWFPGCESALIVRGWEYFADAIKHYPHYVPWLYRGPTNWALGFLPQDGAMGPITGRSFRLEKVRGDDLRNCLPEDSKCSLEDLIARHECMLCLIKQGLICFRQGLTGHSRHALEEIAIASTMYACFRSVLNLLKIYREKLTRGCCRRDAYLQIMADELENVELVLPYLEQDSRLGYHSEAQEYMFTADTVRKKRDQLKEILKNKISGSVYSSSNQKTSVNS